MSETIRLRGRVDEEATANVGLISGGQTVNTVAPWAKCEIDLRYDNRVIVREGV